MLRSEPTSDPGTISDRELGFAVLLLLLLIILAAIVVPNLG